MDLQDKAIRRFRRHLAALFVLKYAVPLATVWGFVWGTAVLALRAAAGVERTPLLWGALGLAACLAAALMLARRRMPSDTVIRALLDEQSGSGGLLMAGAEQDLGGWRQRLPDLKPPRPHWDGRRAGTLLAIAAGFVLLSFLAPRGLADLRFRSPLEIDREIDRLLKQLALLKKEAILEPTRAEALAKKAAELKEHSSGKDPSRTLEALDHLRNLTREAARQSAENSTQRSQHLGEAQALAEALLQNADLLDPQLMKEVLAELESLTDKDGLPPELKKALRQQKLDPEELKKLAGMLRGKMGNLRGRMESLHMAGLIDAECLARCRNPGEYDFEQLRAFLRDNSGKISLADFKSL
ncbi:MAG: hypothetical protein ACYC3I_00745 [Gemmataceae bacterium]